MLWADIPKVKAMMEQVDNFIVAGALSPMGGALVGEWGALNVPLPKLSPSLYRILI